MRAGNRFSGRQGRLIHGFIGLLSRLGKHSDVQRQQRIKFVGYRDLLDLLEKPECPACAIAHRSIDDFLSVAFVEELTMPEFRNPLRASLGFCRLHSGYVRAAARVRLKAMGIAVVYEDLLALVQEHLRQRRAVPLISGCPLCRLQQDLEAYAVQLIADYCHDSEFQNAYELSAGVCLPHLKGLLQLLDTDARNFITHSHQKKLGTLLMHLQEFIRKHDYRFSREKLTEHEAASGMSAVTMVVGY